MKIFDKRYLCRAFVFAMCLAVPSYVMGTYITEKERSHELQDSSIQCSPDFVIFADLIFWTAREAGADNWAEAIVSDENSISNDLQQVHFGWDPGFRVGVGCGMDCNEWDTQIYYTWFYTQGKDHASKGPGTIHSTFLGNFYVDNPFGLGLSGPSYESASIDWTIRFNIFDWELGCNFCASKALLLRPFIGIKGGWIHQFIHSKWKNPTTLFQFEFFQVGTEDIKNNFWGIGPNIGINTKWIVLDCENQCFSIVGDFSGALMWGHWSFTDEFIDDLQQKVTVDLQNINSGASMVRIFMGFEWNTAFRCGCNRFSTKIGYEMQFWLDQLQFYSFTGGRLNNALTLQGGTLELCLDF